MAGATGRRSKPSNHTRLIPPCFRPGKSAERFFPLRTRYPAFDGDNGDLLQLHEWVFLANSVPRTSPVAAAKAKQQQQQQHRQDFASQVASRFTHAVRLPVFPAVLRIHALSFTQVEQAALDEKSRLRICPIYYRNAHETL